MPQNYAQHIPQFDAIGPITTQKHIDKMNDFADLEEVSDGDVQVRLFAQSLAGEVRKWYRVLAVGSIANL